MVTYVNGSSLKSKYVSHTGRLVTGFFAFILPALTVPDHLAYTVNLGYFVTNRK